jgi:DNA topoisomerase VI subunit B
MVQKSTGSSSQLKRQSPAEFFAKHQNIAGFDNPGKALFTTIREFVENAIDAAEAIPALPNILLHIEKIADKDLQSIRNGEAEILEEEDQPMQGIETLEMEKEQDEVEEDAPAEEEEEEQGKSSQETKKRKLSNAARTGAGADEAYFRVTCKDNGIGMKHEDIPNMLGIVLSSTKYDLKQTRGKFGLGAKMALVWSKKSTGLPIEVFSSANSSGLISYYKLDLNVQSNTPNIIESKKIQNPKKWRGTEISVVIRGKWNTYRVRIEFEY